MRVYFGLSHQETHLITVWLLEDRSCQNNPPFLLQLFKLCSSNLDMLQVGLTESCCEAPRRSCAGVYIHCFISYHITSYERAELRLETSYTCSKVKLCKI
jgi:hypothetical protein